MNNENIKISNDNIIPEHIAVIMDGNGRWAKKRGLLTLLFFLFFSKLNNCVVEVTCGFGSNCQGQSLSSNHSYSFELSITYYLQE